MSTFSYSQLDKLIDEYDTDIKSIRSDKLIMINYPKLFVMSAASLFELQIKERCKDFINFPLTPINPNYPNIITLSNQNRNKPMTDKMFAKLMAYDSSGVETLNANEFYLLFGGHSFKSAVESNFITILSNRISDYEKKTDALSILIGQGDNQLDSNYAKFSEIVDRLRRCNFSVAENAYLSLKLRRNRVAHDFINGMSDTFNDIRFFYLDAVAYVIALELTIEHITNITPLAIVT